MVQIKLFCHIEQSEISKIIQKKRDTSASCEASRTTNKIWIFKYGRVKSI